MLDEVWGPGIAAVRRECHHPEFLASVLQEVVDARLHELFPGCRLFRIDSELQGEDGDRRATQRFFVLRPSDARLYQLQLPLDMLALARAEDVVLERREIVEAFALLALGVQVEMSIERSASAWVVGDRSGESRDQLILKIDSRARLVDVLRVTEGAPEEECA